jgi:signal transduction histidine kinase
MTGAILFRLPLVGKLVGANLLVVAAALLASLADEAATGRYHVGVRLLVALTVALALNVGLVVLALRPLRTIQEVAEGVSRGALDLRVPPSRVADPNLALLAETLNLLLDHLAAERSRIRELASRSIASADHDRAGLGRVLHDDVAQQLAGLVFQLAALDSEAGALGDALPNTSAASEGDDHAAALALGERARTAKDTAVHLMEDVRSLAHNVHPRVLDDLGLASALRQLAREVSAREGIPVVVEGEGFPALSRASAITLYRAVEEALENAVRHGSPSRICVRACRDDALLTVEIADDGRGFDFATAAGAGTGLFTMRERLALFDGCVEVHSELGAGTRVVVSLALSPASARGKHEVA